MSLTAEKRNIMRSFEALGTVNEIRACSEDERPLDMAARRVGEIEHMMSAFDPKSEISALNKGAGHIAAAVHPETIKLLTKAAEVSALSGGAFDITVRPLVELWGIDKKQDYIPVRRNIRLAKRLADYRCVQINEDAGWAFLKRKCQAVDLGGIAKGYAADEVKRILVAAGITSAIINLGGNIVTIGARPDGQPFRIGIQNPAAERGVFAGSLLVTDKTVVTSAVNERFFIKNGVRYHHIIDPRTGWPARSGLLSVTAVSDSAMTADALSTAAFVLGLKRGTALLKKCGAQGIFITEKHEVYATDGLKDIFQISKL